MLSNDRRAVFVDHIMPVILWAHRKEPRLFPSVLAAQAGHETGFGASQLFTDANNLFGIKWYAGHEGRYDKIIIKTWEVINGENVVVEAAFCRYESLQHCLSHYLSILTKMPRYASVLTAASPDAQIEAIAKSGWATDPAYIAKVKQFLPVSIHLDALYYPDVAIWHPHIDAIKHAYQTGRMVGYEDGSFGPQHPVTRAQLAEIVYRMEVKRQ